MTEYIPQTSASERIEAARKAIRVFDAAVDSIADATDLDEHEQGEARAERAALDCVAALRALITPPPVGETEEQIAERIVREKNDGWDWDMDIALKAVRAGIQSAHLTWEPADHPSQEMMLRWLGLTTERDDYGELYIPAQRIEKEVI